MSAIDAEEVEAAIGAAERMTSAEIKVSVAPFFWGNVYRNAERAFDRLGMRQTRERNGVLFFIVPSRHKFVVLGDEGVHAHVGQEFWNELRDRLGAAFRDDEYTRGLVAAIETVGTRLSALFPANPDDNPDELSNEVDFGEARARLV